MKVLVCDVGSGSVRVGIFEYSDNQQLNSVPLAYATQPITIFNPETNHYEQRSGEIWNAFCTCTRKCLQESNVESVDSIAFSSTCSLVILEEERDDRNDTIMWMDHRANSLSQRITKENHPVLQQFGGSCSPEFSLAKLIWLANHQDPHRYENAEGFMELNDWLTYRCSTQFGDPDQFPRSLCSVVCKWGYDAEKSAWPIDFFRSEGITRTEKFGSKFVSPGHPVGQLSEAVSKELGFKTFNAKTVLASPLIDAHAGMLAMLVFGGTSNSWENVLGLIAGTSNCLMLLNEERTFTKGIWGPYKHAIVPDFYLREAGQSATGKLIDHVISNYFDEPPNDVKSVIAGLNTELVKKNISLKIGLLVNPTFHGNRSPIGNYDLKGAIYGLTLEKPNLEDLYVATIEALAYETKYILEELQGDHERIEQIIVTGGLTKNEVYMQLHSDILDCSLTTFSAGKADLMLVGASIIAHTALEDSSKNLNDCFNTLKEKNNLFKSNAKVFHPRDDLSAYHARKYQAYKALLKASLEISNIDFLGC